METSDLMFNALRSGIVAVVVVLKSYAEVQYASVYFATARLYLFRAEDDL